MTVVCLILILLFWGENYGSGQENSADTIPSPPPLPPVTSSLTIDISHQVSSVDNISVSSLSPKKRSSKSTVIQSPTRSSPRIRARRGECAVDTSAVSTSDECEVTTVSTSAGVKHVKEVEPDKCVSTSVTSSADISIWQVLMQHPEICVLGLSQACFEGAAYSFGMYIYSHLLDILVLYII